MPYLKVVKTTRTKYSTPYKKWLINEVKRLNIEIEKLKRKSQVTDVDALD
tara:strand:+ start:465 stop:614 length:150 start_codon:yes stop_codon:yes gene_type:complete